MADRPAVRPRCSYLVSGRQAGRSTTPPHSSRVVVADSLHLQRVVDVVGRQVQAATRAEAMDELGHDIGSDQAAMTLAVLRPRVGEPDAHLVERRGRQSGQEVEHVTVDHPHVGQRRSDGRLEHGRQPGGVHLDADDALVRTGTGQVDQRLPGAEADVEHERTVGAEHVGQAQGWPVDRQTPTVGGGRVRRGPHRATGPAAAV